MLHDPFRLGFRAGPLPVSGELQPPLALVDEDDLSAEQRHPRWVRLTAWAVAIGFAVGSTVIVANGGAPLLGRHGAGFSGPERTPAP